MHVWAAKPGVGEEKESWQQSLINFHVCFTQTKRNTTGWKITFQKLKFIDDDVFFCVLLPMWLLCDCTRRRLYTDLIVIIIIIMIMIVITILLILSSFSLHPKRKSYLNNKELTGSFLSSLSKSILTRVLLTLSASERAISPPTYGSLLRRSTLRIVLLSAITSARAIIPTKIREY